MEPSEIRLTPCRRCGGRPVMILQPGFPADTVRVECTGCCLSTPAIFYAPHGGVAGYGANRILLPSLWTARRQAAAAWNEGCHDRTH